MQELLTENKTLRASLVHLQHEDQIGHARLVSQEHREGRLYSTVRFVQTARGNPNQTVAEHLYEIEGNIVHFDALIVRFEPDLVADGRARALYLWRRVYGEHMQPSEGYPIETPGSEPARYADLLNRLGMRERMIFWENIWELANDPTQLEEYGVSATYGNAIYSQLQPGLVYVFKITASGQIYPEAVPQYSLPLEDNRAGS